MSCAEGIPTDRDNWQIDKVHMPAAFGSTSNQVRGGILFR